MRAIPLLLLSAALSTCPAVPAQRPVAGSRPNILFVFSDDHACHAISAYGSAVNRTPHIDRLAATGALFRNNFCGNSLCGPSRATILTGLHSHANGFQRNGNVFDGARTTMPKLLQRVGYQTAMIGKWHLESEPQGFDHWMVLPGQGEYYNPDFLTPAGRVRLEGHVTDITTRLAVEWLEQRDPDRPFLLMCQHKAPHRNWLPAVEDLGLYRDGDVPEPATLFDDHEGRAPGAKAQEMSIAADLRLHYDLLVPPSEGETTQLRGDDRAWLSQRKRMTDTQREAFDAAYAADNAAFRRSPPTGKARVRWQYQRYVKNYLRCVAGVDRSVGQLLDWLDAHPEVKANTLVVYASDQGFYLGDHGFYDKRWMYEESLRMPLLMAWPGHIAPHTEVTALTQNIDFGPTFCELAGAEPLPGAHGRSLLPLLGGDDAGWRDAIYYHYYESQAVHMVPAMFGVRTERYKLVRYYEPQWNCWELFDLEHDPLELRSVADDPAYRQVRAELMLRLGQLRAQYHEDTGVLVDGFPMLAGIARAVRVEDGGVRLRGNAVGSYLLRTGEPGGDTFATTLRPVAGQRLTNGFLVLSGGDPRRDFVRVGIEFGGFEAGARLVLMMPGSMQVVDRAPVEWDGQSAVELSVRCDFERGELVGSARGREVRAPMPAAWRGISAWGYGLSDAETVFGRIVVR